MRDSKNHHAETDVKKEPWSPCCIDAQSRTPSTIIQVLGRSPKVKPDICTYAYRPSIQPNQKIRKHDLYAASQTSNRKMPCYVTRGLYVYAKEHSHV